MRNKIARTFAGTGVVFFVMGLIGSVVCGVFVPAYEDSQMFNWGITLEMFLLSCILFAVFLGFAEVIEIQDKQRKLTQQSRDTLLELSKSLKRVEDAVAGPPEEEEGQYAFE